MDLRCITVYDHIEAISINCGVNVLKRWYVILFVVSLLSLYAGAPPKASSTLLPLIQKTIFLIFS